jgi:pyridinium-3,5-bisthiocarboxylic acid mononucleotide nickel chelatase
MRIAYLDCSAGVSGNMLVGSFVSMGLPQEILLNELRKLPIHLPELTFSAVQRQGIQAILFEVNETHQHHHRSLSDILTLIDGAGFERQIALNAKKCFTLLAEAEAKIHGVTVEEVHFHEVGALDAIIDIVSACIGMVYFQIEKIIVSPIRVGYGSIACAHGIIPIPAPATMELLSGFKIYGGEIEGEWATPTGSAILKIFASESGSIPQMETLKVGYGAGSLERTIPNVLRIMLGNHSGLGENGAQQDVLEQLVVLETNIDDMNPELYGYLGDLLLEAGVKDYYFTPIQMKKGRPGVLITVLTSLEKASQIEKILLTETTTIGVRKYQVQRRCLQRNMLKVEVAGREVSIKTAWQEDILLNYAPEYEDCLKIARESSIPLKDIYDEAKNQARKILKNGGAC